MSLCLSSQGCAVGEEARTTRVPNANGRITAYCAHVHAIFFSSERFDLVLPVNFSRVVFPQLVLHYLLQAKWQCSLTLTCVYFYPYQNTPNPIFPPFRA